MDWTSLDAVLLALAIAVTLYVIVSKNPYEPGTNRHAASKANRAGTVFLVWSIDFGILGIILGLVAFYFGINSYIKERSRTGLIILLAAIISVAWNLNWVYPISQLIYKTLGLV